MTGNRIGFVDFGLVEALDPVFERNLFRYIRAVYRNDVEEMISGLDEILVPGEMADPTAFRREFLEESRRLQRERGREDGAGSAVSSYMMGVLRAARRHDLWLPTGILAIYRSLLTAEMVAHQLAPAVSLGSVGADFFERLQREALLRMPDIQELQTEVLNLIEILRDAPGKVDRLLSNLTSDRFRLRVEQVLSLADRRLQADQVRLIVAGLIWIGLTVLFGATRDLMSEWPWLSTFLWSVLGANALWLFVLWRRLP